MESFSGFAIEGVRVAVLSQDGRTGCSMTAAHVARPSRCMRKSARRHDTEDLAVTAFQMIEL